MLMKMKMKMGLKSTLTVAPRREIEVNWTVGNQEFNAIQFDFHLTNITIWNETFNIMVFNYKTKHSIYSLDIFAELANS